MELTDDEDETVLEELESQAEALTTARTTDIPSAERAQHRSRAQRLVREIRTQPKPDLSQRMAAAARYLDLLAAGVWGVDESWRGDLRDLVHALAPTEAEQEEGADDRLGKLSSLIAICLALLLQDADLHGGAERDVIAKDAWEEGHTWAAFADQRHIEGMLRSSSQVDARVVTSSEVEEVIELAMTAADDPHAAALAALDAEGHHTELIDGVWVIDGEFRNPLRVAARAATLIGAGCVVLARNGHRSAVIMWHDVNLAMAESTVPRWRLYRVTPPTTPQTKFAGTEGLPSTRDIHPLAPAPERVRQLAAASGVSLPMLLAALR